MNNYLRLIVAVSVAMVLFAAGFSAAGPAALDYGEVFDARIPNRLRGVDANEGYFYTHGPVMVMAWVENYGDEATVVIRDPANPDTPVAQGVVSQWIPYRTTLPSAGFYYISVSSNDTLNIRPQVLVGVSDTAECNGYYHYRALSESGSDYLNDPDAHNMFVRGTNGCDDSLYVFSPRGASEGHIQVGQIDTQYWDFDLATENNFMQHQAWDAEGRLRVNSGNEVMVLNRDDLGYFVPPYMGSASDNAYHYTYVGEDEYLNIHSFKDGTTYRIYTLEMFIFKSPILVTSGTLDEGETYTFTGEGGFTRNNVLKIRTTKGQASVSVIGGESSADNDNYMSYMLDPAGNMQGTDFITRSHFGGFIYVTGLEDGTTVEVRDAESGLLQSTHNINQAQIVNVNPGTGIWRVRANKDITACVGKGNGGTFIPMTKNVSGSTPFPPVVAGVNWDPIYPMTSDGLLTIRWLTDELARCKLHYKIGSGSWQESSQTALDTEHSYSLNISSLSQDTDIHFRIEATDQSNSTTLDDNDGDDYVVTVHEDTPDLSVTLDSVADHDSYYRLTFRVDNNGSGEARYTKLKLQFKGMQPYTDGVDSDYSGISSNRIIAELPVGTVYPGSMNYASIEVVPYLSHSGGGTYALENCTSETVDAFGHTQTKTHPSETHYWTASTIESRMQDSRYVILTNLARFFYVNSSTDADAQAMPREMTSFALARNATLAYISTGDPHAIRSYIQGNFNSKIHQDWRSGGYLLLVGCSVVIPSWHWSLHCTFDETKYASMSDNTYANLNNDGHYTPEICIGRITGNSPSTYNSLFERALSPIYFDKAICISGTGDGEGAFSSNANSCKNRLDDLYPMTPGYFRLKNYAAGDRKNVYLNNANQVDFLYYRNHGGVGGWDHFGAGDVSSISFGGKFPIIYSNACLTGQIQSSNNLAEAFLDHSAAVFIGATEVSPRSVNNKMGKKITSRHRNGQTIGKAFRNAKRSLAGGIHWYTTCYQDRDIKRDILTYNLYGDPMRGGSSPGASKMETLDLSLAGEELPIVIPMFEVETRPDGLDQVTIPDEEHADELLVINEPIVPSYRYVAEIEPGRRINDVTLISRADPVNESGLDLPAAWTDEKETPGPGDVPSPGVFPEDDFHWTNLELPDGSTEFVLTVHPFFYNATTQDATFYPEYLFDLDIVETSVSIQDVVSKYEEVPVDETQRIQVTMFNDSGEERKVDLIVDIADAGESVSVATLSVNSISIGQGEQEVREVSWSTSGQDPTHYQVTITVEDSSRGEVQDVAYTRFRVGQQDVSITDFFMSTDSPGYVGDAEDVELRMEIKNAGDIPVSGTMFLQIRQDDGSIFQSWEEGFQDLGAGDTTATDQILETTGIPSGDYKYQGWAFYDGGVTTVAEISFSTLDNMRFGWTVPETIYQRGDKIAVTGDLVGEDGSVLGKATSSELGVIYIDFPWPLVLEKGEHDYSPHYSTSFMSTAEMANGPYAFLVNASKPGYRNVTIFDMHSWGRFVLTDYPFTMSGDTLVCPADGESTITVSTDVVLHEGEPVPDGTLLNLRPWGGTILAEDADPERPNIQVPSVDGRFEFEWQAPEEDWRDAFLFAAGITGGATPMSGLNAVFKGIDFNDNKRVDVADILFVHTGEGSLAGTDGYDRRKDMDEDQVISVTDTMTIFDRWGWELSGAVHCPTCPPDIGQPGVTLRPVPEQAVIPPGGELVVEIMADGINNLGAFEFGTALAGDALVWGGTPEVAGLLPEEQMTMIADGYGNGYRLGAWSNAVAGGPSSSTRVATLVLQADEIGDCTLVLSAPVFAQLDGNEQEIFKAIAGHYEVAEYTPTPTSTPTSTFTRTATATETAVDTSTPSATATDSPMPTATWTEAPTATNTPSRTATEIPTATPTAAPGDTNQDGRVDGHDLFFFSHEWQHSATGEHPCNMMPDEVIDNRDLLLLLKEWCR